MKPQEMEGIKFELLRGLLESRKKNPLSQYFKGRETCIFTKTEININTRKM